MLPLVASIEAALDGRWFLVTLYLAGLAAFWVLGRRGVVDRQVRWVLIYAGLVALPFVLERWGVL